MNQAKQGLFVAGTDTEVGKTYVASMIVKRLREADWNVGVYKPIASGCRMKGGTLWSADAQQLWDAAGRPKEIEDVTPQRFAAPLAPHVAAREENRTVDASLLRTGLETWSDCDCVVVEGVGGLLSPISDSDLVADLARDINYPVVIVVPNVLGAINQALLSLVAAEKYELGVAGIIINSPTPRGDASSRSNEREIAKRAQVPVLAHLRFGETQLHQDPVEWMGAGF